MRYLKKFNENLSDDEMLKIKDFCESHLAYLLDKGFSINVSTMPFKRDSDRDSQFALAATFNRNRQYRSYQIELIASTVSNWNDIKDYFIPFMNIMVDEFQCTFKNISFKGLSHYSFSASAISVMNDSFSEEMSKIDGIGTELKITKITINLLDKEVENSSVLQ